jgi:hypothetical protein
MIDEAQEREQAQALVEPFNRSGAEVTLLADGRQFRLGPGVTFRVLRVAEDAAGGVDFWLFWQALAYQEGPQFSHTVRIVSAAAAAADDLRLTDSAGQVLHLVPLDAATWKQWQNYRRQHAGMFARVDRELLEEHQYIADHWRE